MPCRAAKPAARSADRDATATSSAPGTCAKSGTTLSAIRPGPTTPHRTVLMFAILARRARLYTAVDDHVDKPEQPFERYRLGGCKSRSVTNDHPSVPARHPDGAPP